MAQELIDLGVMSRADAAGTRYETTLSSSLGGSQTGDVGRAPRHAGRRSRVRRLSALTLAGSAEALSGGEREEREQRDRGNRPWQGVPHAGLAFRGRSACERSAAVTEFCAGREWRATRPAGGALEWRAAIRAELAGGLRAAGGAAGRSRSGAGRGGDGHRR